jgi:hypothetical protein
VWESQVKHFVVVQEDGPLSYLVGEHSRWCMEEKPPFVCISLRRKYASVTLDTQIITSGYHLTKAGVEAVQGALETASCRRARIRSSWCHASSTKVPIERAEALATELYAIAMSLRQKHLYDSSMRA